MSRAAELLAWVHERKRPVLIIACGTKKRPPGPDGFTWTYWAWNLYLGPLWTTYRAWMENTGLSPTIAQDLRGKEYMSAKLGERYSLVPIDHRLQHRWYWPPFSVWVVSAKHGLIRQTSLLRPYDKQLTKQNFSTFVKFLKNQIKSDAEVKTLESREVFFAGPKIYAEALEEAGLEIENLGGKGWGGMRKNLRTWLDARVEA